MLPTQMETLKIPAIIMLEAMLKKPRLLRPQYKSRAAEGDQVVVAIVFYPLCSGERTYCN
jgi:NhaP-type Na+/H+ and K+/H+ antiporter